MSGCCAPPGYAEIFGEKQAARDARRYRRKGLGEAAQRVVDLAGEAEGKTVLEIGGGVGAIQLDLLKRGAARATNVELSKGYESQALELARAAGVDDRIERHFGDVATGLEVPEADVVVLHRVVCCYPDPERLVSAAAGRARRRLVLSFPSNTRFMRLGATAINLWLVPRHRFRFYVHEEATIRAAAESRGLRVAAESPGGIWNVLGFERP